MVKKNALQEAIAEAKQLRQAAIVNATKQLEENLTPSIKAMLERKLEEEFGADVLDEAKTDINGFTEVKPEKKEEPKKEVKEAEEPEDKDTEEAPEEEKGDEKEDANEEPAEEPEEGGEEEAPEEEQPEESDEEPENPEDAESEELPDDTPLKDITLGDLKAIIAQEIANAAPVEEPTDLESPEVGDVEGQGDEVPAGDLAATNPEDVPADDASAEVPADQPDPELVDPEAEEKKKEDDDEEIDINEILKELEDDNVNDVMPTNQNGKVHDGGVGKGIKTKHQDGEVNDLEEGKDKKEVCPECGKEVCVCDKKEDKNLKERYETVVRTNKVLRETLAEVNVLNSKLVYANKTLRRRSLTEDQKNSILENLDKAKTIAEAKETYNKAIKEFGNGTGLMENRNRQFASKSAGQSTKPEAIVEDSFVRRMQELAGIIE